MSDPDVIRFYQAVSWPRCTVSSGLSPGKNCSFPYYILSFRLLARFPMVLTLSPATAMPPHVLRPALFLVAPCSLFFAARRRRNPLVTGLDARRETALAGRHGRCGQRAEQKPGQAAMMDEKRQSTESYPGHSFFMAPRALVSSAPMASRSAPAFCPANPRRRESCPSYAFVTHREKENTVRLFISVRGAPEHTASICD